RGSLIDPRPHRPAPRPLGRPCGRLTLRPAHRWLAASRSGRRFLLHLRLGRRLLRRLREKCSLAVGLHQTSRASLPDPAIADLEAARQLSIRLPGVVGSPEFNRAYEDALAGRASDNSTLVRPAVAAQGTIEALVRSYMQN